MVTGHLMFDMLPLPLYVRGNEPTVRRADLA